MISILYKMIYDEYHTDNNKLIPINSDYGFMNEALGDLSKINIFIGENNSGKSRFLRELFLKNFYGMSLENFEKFFKEMKMYSYGSYEQPQNINILDFDHIYKKNGQNNALLNRYGIDFFKVLYEFSKSYERNDKYYFPVIRGVKDYKTVINNKLSEFLKNTQSIQNKDSINHFISLLNLEQTGLENFDIYSEIVFNEYFKEQKKTLQQNIITGGKLYNEIKKMLLGKEDERKTIEEFQKFLKVNFFEDFDKVQLIPNETEKVLYVKIGKDERPIYNWGDGTQQLIIILFYLYVHKDEKDKLFFIEEPEMYFHPGILRKFIEVLNMDIFSNHQYFITTHSNAILDTSADTNINMSIFKFKKVKDISSNNDKEFLIEQCNNGDVSLLNELGVRNSSVFLSNCSIWVEGITDRLYLKHYLDLFINKYNKEKFRENIDYTFIEYGGGNVVHFNFSNEDNSQSINAKYINNKIFLIADNDNTQPGSAKQSRKEKYKEYLQDNFYELPVTEIENLISNEILKNVLIQQNLGKKEDIINKFEDNKDYRNVRLGKFIDDLFCDSDLKKYSSDSGTIKNKLSFCNLVIEKTTDYDMLTKEAKELVEKVYDFILKNNNK